MSLHVHKARQRRVDHSCFSTAAERTGIIVILTSKGHQQGDQVDHTYATPDSQAYDPDPSQTPLCVAHRASECSLQNPGSSSETQLCIAYILLHLRANHDWRRGLCRSGGPSAPCTHIRCKSSGSTRARHARAVPASRSRHGHDPVLAAWHIYGWQLPIAVYKTGNPASHPHSTAPQVPDIHAMALQLPNAIPNQEPSIALI